MKFISLFSGIGGLDLGLERAGMECVAQVEIDDFCRSILAKHWPHIPKYTDVKEYHPDTDVDVVAGGFPCQDVSLAGKRAGLAGSRSGLFFQAMRVVDESGARFVILENVQGLLSSNGGRDFGRVLEELAERGFDAEWEILPASAFGALHERKRLIVVAYRDGPLVEGHLLEASRERRASLESRRLSSMAACAAARQRPGTELVGEPRLARLVHGSSGGVDASRRKAVGNAVYPALAEYIGQSVVRFVTP